MDSKYLEIIEKGVVKCKSETIDTDTLESNEALIENEASIISAGTELSRVFALKPGITFPIRPGYGSIGHIIAKGEALNDYEIGQRVFYAGQHCSINKFKCSSKDLMSHIFKVPEDIDPIEATMVCMINICLTAPNNSNVKLGDKVAVFGLGMVGLLAALLYELAGTTVFGIDPVQTRCDFARSMGIQNVISCPPEKQVDAIMALTNQQGVDISVEAVGHSSVIKNAVLAARKFGEVILLGTPRVEYQGNITEVFNPIHMKTLTVKGNLTHCVPLKNEPGMKLSTERNITLSFDLIKSKKIDASKLISHIIKPEEAEETYHGLYKEKDKYRCAVIDWSQDEQN